MTYSDLFRDSLLELGAIDPLDDVPAELQELARVRYNGIINQRNARQEWAYAVTYPTFTTTGGLSPHTIGPTGTFTVGQRPVNVLGVNQQQNSGVSLINIGPQRMRDRAWWLSMSVPNIQSGVPTDLYYEPTWPNGELFFWPVPSTAYVVQFELRVVLDEIAVADVTTTFSLPPAYQRDLMLTLAEDLCGPLTLPLPGSLMLKTQRAQSDTQANNNPPVRIHTRDSGMMSTGTRGTSGGFNWRSGTGGGR